MHAHFMNTICTKTNVKLCSKRVFSFQKCVCILKIKKMFVIALNLIYCKFNITQIFNRNYLQNNEALEVFSSVYKTKRTCRQYIRIVCLKNKYNCKCVLF